jgi:hypothetical protein
MRHQKGTALERWETEGGAVPPALLLREGQFIEPTISRTRVVPHIDHKPPPDDDCGLAPHPIYADYVKDLWHSHTRSGGVPSLVRSRRRVGGRNDCEKLS